MDVIAPPLRRRPGPPAVIAVALVWAVLHQAGRNSGSTREERRRPLPGDHIVRRPQTVSNHATTLAAPPEEVWPWLMQVGWHRGGWYTPRWVDVLLFPDNLPSADTVLPGYADLRVGDVVPDGPPETGCGFEVREVHRNVGLVLESTTHLPASWRNSGIAGLHWTWAFDLTPVAGGSATRLLFRWRARTRPWWLTVAAHGLILPADLVMSRGMFRGLARRVGGQQGAPE
jgi:hypothetical protein